MKANEAEKYIPKSALVAEIEKRLDELYELLPDASKVENGSITTSEACNTGKYTALESFRRFIDTIAVKEVDFESEWKKYFEYRGDVATVNIKHLAKHFFELGLSVSNSTKVTIPDIDDVLKENGVNPYSKEAKIIKESYFMAIEKLAQKGKEYEHGSTLV